MSPSALTVAWRNVWTLLCCALFLCTLARAQVPSDDAQALIEQLQVLRDRGDHSPEAVAELARITTRVNEQSPYALRRELMRTQLVVLDETRSYAQTQTEMQALRKLAAAHQDRDTVHRMDIELVFMNHVDDDIKKSILQLNAVRATLDDEESADVMEALERSYGNMYFDAGNFELALRHQLAALDWARQLKIGSAKAQLYRHSTIADLYVAMDLPDAALQEIETAFALPIDAMPAGNRISLLNSRAMALIHKNQLADAEIALNQAEALNRSRDSIFDAMRLATARVQLLLARKDLDLATLSLAKLEQSAAKRGNTYYLAKSWLLRGSALLQSGDVEHGMALMNQALAFFRDKGQMIDLLAGLKRQVTDLREQGRDRQAIEVMTQQQALWKTLFRNERAYALAEVEAQRQARQQRTRISQLAAENSAQQSRLRAEQLETALALSLAALALLLCGFLGWVVVRHRRERRVLSNAARYDALTGAFNRYEFLQRSTRLAQSEEKANAVILLDVDHFKAINDRYGHEAGDAVLQALVTLIRQQLAPDDELYRWGGEEFLLLLSGRRTNALTESVQDLLSALAAQRMDWHGQTLTIRVSGGCISHPMASSWTASLDDALHWVDAALYLAKNAGRGQMIQVHLNDAGISQLRGKHPTDMHQLQAWQQQGWVRLETITP